MKDRLIQIFYCFIVGCILLLFFFATSGCSHSVAGTKTNDYTYIQGGKGNWEAEVVVVNHNGVCHEYLVFRDNFTREAFTVNHWEDCKYCKHHKQANN